ncbi:hypothetical protein WN55_09497 [Dufourea novaeangliae]|uniref:Uncharacterized protein n=1 Tax=Dufourea novaeangliae TaxID=178035 RepID=A0A154P0B9_DUFNO|nr:hypothetical protein WN55_09497 [Dufourea novaeangliae]
MVKLRAIVTLTLFVILSINLVEPLMHKSLSKFLGSLASVKHVRIPEVLNQLCNESQGSDTIRQDACYGCFYKATNQPLGYPLLVAMSSCADLYLNNTDYDHCQRYLNNATSTPNTRINPTTIYCTFLECIRQVNKDNLVSDFSFYSKMLEMITRDLFKDVKTPPKSITRSQLRQCVGEAVRMSPGFNNTDVQLAQLYVNTTACVLAKTRCALMNPITGEYQEDDLADKLHIPTVNAVLVNTDYDINIVQLPFHHGSIDVCTKQRNFEQASWPTVTC